MTDIPSGSSPSPRLVPPPRATEREGSGRPLEPEDTSGPGPLAWILVAGGLAGVVFAVVALPRFVVRLGSQPTPTATTQASPGTGETAEAAATATKLPNAAEPSPSAGLSPPDPSASGSSASGPDPTRPPGPPPDFASAMTEGHAALARSAFDEARQAFLRAENLQPDSAQAKEGLARADEGRRAMVLMEQLSRAKSFEEQEDWAAAATAYLAALSTDGTVIAAQEGRARTVARAELAGRLSFHTRNKERLGTASVFEEAERLLAQAREVSPQGPQHRALAAGLEGALTAARAAVRVELESDGDTEVILLRVGRLGRFARKELALVPGTYTVVGSRSGYRDARAELRVEAGKTMGPLTIRCTEAVKK